MYAATIPLPLTSKRWWRETLMFSPIFATAATRSASRSALGSMASFLATSSQKALNVSFLAMKSGSRWKGPLASIGNKFLSRSGRCSDRSSNQRRVLCSSRDDRFNRRRFLRWTPPRILGFVFSARLTDRLSNDAQDEAHRANGVVITGNRIIDKLRIAVCIHDGDNGNFQPSGFRHGVVLAFDVHDKHGWRITIHGADAVEVLMQPGRFPSEHGLLLFDVVVDRAVRFHLFNLFETTDGTLDGLQIGKRAAEPALGHVKLAALLSRLLDRVLRLLFRANEQYPAAFADGLMEKTARGFELSEGLAEVDDVDTVAGIKDERSHLGVPTTGLVSEVDARFQQFFNADTDHRFPLVVSPSELAEGPSRGSRDLFRCCSGRPVHLNQGLILRPFRLSTTAGYFPPERKG